MITAPRAAAAKFRKSISWHQLTNTSTMLDTVDQASYPKHVWSPAGGWYSQPSNWKANTAVFGMVIVGVTAMMWKLSAEREVRTKFPEEGRFFPSR